MNRLANLLQFCYSVAIEVGVGLGQGPINVGRFQLRLGLQDALAAAAAGDQRYDRAHRDPQPTDAELAAHRGRIVADPWKRHRTTLIRNSLLAASRQGFSSPTGLVLHKERLNPVVMTLLADPIGDGDGSLGHLKPLPESPDEALQHQPGQSPKGAGPGCRKGDSP